MTNEIRELTADELHEVSGGADVHVKVGPLAVDATKDGISLTAFNHQVTFWY